MANNLWAAYTGVLDTAAELTIEDVALNAAAKSAIYVLIGWQTVTDTVDSVVFNGTDEGVQIDLVNSGSGEQVELWVIYPTEQTTGDVVVTFSGIVGSAVVAACVVSSAELRSRWQLTVEAIAQPAWTNTASGGGVGETTVTIEDTNKPLGGVLGMMCARVGALGSIATTGVEFVNEKVAFGLDYYQVVGGWYYATEDAMASASWALEDDYIYAALASLTRPHGAAPILSVGNVSNQNGVQAVA